MSINSTAANQGLGEAAALLNSGQQNQFSRN